MRQFFSWRIWTAFGALVGLVVLLTVVLPSGSDDEPTANAQAERVVQFASLVYVVQPSDNFAVRNGVVTGSADLIIDGQRTMHVLPGTFGDLQCDDYEIVAKCVVLADLLGDAVVWFALVPVQQGLRVDLPPIEELLDDGVARLRNGWLVPLASAVDRQCDDEETSSLSEFLQRFGPASTTVFDVARQRVSIVRCAADALAAAQASTTTLAASIPESTAPSILGPANESPASTTG